MKYVHVADQSYSIAHNTKYTLFTPHTKYFSILSDALAKGETTPVSTSDYSGDGKVPIALHVHSYISQSSSVLFDGIHSHQNIIKLYPF